MAPTGVKEILKGTVIWGGGFVICLIVELITDCEFRYPFVLSYNYYVNKQSTQLSIYLN
jgi:hypothetical protein